MNYTDPVYALDGPISAIDAVDGSVPVSCAPASGATFPLGTTTVSCSASDTSGNVANGSFTITVQDTTPPILTLPNNLIVPATSALGANVQYVATANDLVDGQLAGGCDPVSNSVFPVGDTTVYCVTTDSHGNTTVGSFTVTVQVGTPRIGASIIGKGRDAAGNFVVDVLFRNSGTGHARNVQINSLVFRTLAGIGTVIFIPALSGPLPHGLGNIDVGGSVVYRVYLSVPSTVTRFSIAEGGTLNNVLGDSFSFSMAQAVIP